MGSSCGVFEEQWLTGFEKCQMTEIENFLNTVQQEKEPLS